MNIATGTYLETLVTLPYVTKVTPPENDFEFDPGKFRKKSEIVNGTEPEDLEMTEALMKSLEDFISSPVIEDNFSDHGKRREALDELYIDNRFLYDAYMKNPLRRSRISNVISNSFLYLDKDDTETGEIFSCIENYDKLTIEEKKALVEKTRELAKKILTS